MATESELRNHCHINTNDNGDTFVGVKSDGTALSVCFPIGYCLPDDNRVLRHDVLNLITVLAKFSGLKEKNLPQNQIFSHDTVDFPIQAYLSIMNHFLNSGYYSESEIHYKPGSRGKKSWPRTIKQIKPSYQENSERDGYGSFVYLDYIVKENASNDTNLITLVHEYCVYESYEKVGWLFNMAPPQKPRLRFDKKMFLGTVYEKLGKTFSDATRELFSSMIAMINYLGDNGSINQFYFGTDRFEYVWENLIDFTYGVDDKDRYFPHTVWNLKTGRNRQNAALEPDTIMVVGNKIFVLDAKYYRYGTTAQPLHLPESTSINKQITYGEYVASQEAFKREFGPDMKVYNAFIMPFGKNSKVFTQPDSYRHIGEATGLWKSGEHEYEHVQGILVDISSLMHNYIRQNQPEILKLADLIEQACNSGNPTTATTVAAV